MNGRAGAAVTFLLSFAVVVLVFFLPAQWLALPILGMAIGLLVSRRPTRAIEWLPSVLLAALALVVWLSGSQRAAMLYPVVINLGFCTYFWGSLRGGPSAIERLARLEDPALPFEAIGYTRLLTKVWCGFFVLNGSLAALTAWWGDAKVWAFYNSFLAYLLIGGLIFGERLFRARLLEQYNACGGARPADWLGVGRAEHDLVCRRGEQTFDWGRFRADVAAKAAAIARAPQTVWIVAAEDAYAFAVDLLAVGLAGKEALVPQNHQPATLREVRTRHPDAAAADAVEPSIEGARAWKPVAGGTVTFYTSGSTGEPKRITRALAALRQEAEALEATFGATLGQAEVIGTVPHHFIYGAIFRVLWPLRAGRVFHVEPLADGYAVLAQVQAGGDFALIGSPSMLERLPAEEVPRLAGLKAVFSSGSLLRTEVALRWSAPIEIYGSTETSGVAWRRQSRGGEGWRPLPAVAVALTDTGCLRVDSPYVAPGYGTTADAARMRDDGTFELLGRVDRIAKVEGRRVSLPELEAIVEAHPSVARCALVQPDGVSRLAGVVVLKPGLAVVDYQALLAEFRTLLVERHDAVVAPRRWKFLPTLPVDARGKLDQPRLRALFEPPVATVLPESVWPQLIGHRWAEGEAVITLKVPADLPYFAGHFPGLPILPGIALLTWVKLYDAWLLGGAGEYLAVDNLKFTAAVYPGEVLQLTLMRLPDGGVRFRYEQAGTPKALGALLPAGHAHVV